MEKKVQIIQLEQTTRITRTVKLMGQVITLTSYQKIQKTLYVAGYDPYKDETEEEDFGGCEYHAPVLDDCVVTM